MFGPKVDEEEENLHRLIDVTFAERVVTAVQKRNLQGKCLF